MQWNIFVMGIEYSDDTLKIQTVDSLYLDLFYIFFRYVGNVDFCLQS